MQIVCTSAKKKNMRETEINKEKGELLLNLKNAMESICTGKKGL